MKKFQSLSILAGLILTLGLGASLMAQSQDPTSTPQSQQPSTPQTQPPSTPAQPPDTAAPAPTQQAPSTSTTPGQATSSASSDASGAQVFTGTVVNQGDKYMFQDSASGTTYDIDHQDQVKNFEGKKVRVHGTLDPATKTIHVQ